MARGLSTRLGRLREAGSERAGADRSGRERRRATVNTTTRRPSTLLSRTAERLSELAGYSSAFLILASVLVIGYGVVLRYVVGASTVWQTELSIYFLIYASFV